MAIIVQDFVVSATADFTGKALVDGADHNNLVNEATPASDAESSKGLIVTSVDGVGDVPDVPDVALYPKYAGYIWVRRLLDDSFKMYVWIPTIADHDVTFKKWTDTATDLTAVLADIGAAQADITALYALVAAAQARANAAYDLATDALDKAETAITDSATALTTANAAQITADNALALATAATTALGNIRHFTSELYNTVGITTYNDILNVAHLLGGVPSSFRAVIIPTADVAPCFSAGREYPIDLFCQIFATSTEISVRPAFVSSATSTNVIVQAFHGGVVSFANGLTGDATGTNNFVTLDLNNWKMRVYAQRLTN